jgi:hypothetical protein
MRRLIGLGIVMLSIFVTGPPWGQSPLRSLRGAIDREVAARFAPVFVQGLGDAPRADYITNFDFDGDWKGDNNWANLDNHSFPLRAYVYYSVSETATHYFIHYAVFHPRDYKGGLAKSALLSAILQSGMERLGRDPTGGLVDEIALSHENDLEGCLVVVEKHGRGLEGAEVIAVETMAHNRYLKYRPGASEIEGATRVSEDLELREGRPVLFVEPKGHGVEHFSDDPLQLERSSNGTLTYVYRGRAEEVDSREQREIGYDLLPIYETFWTRAQKGANETYGEAFNYRGFALAGLTPAPGPTPNPPAKTKSAAKKEAAKTSTKVAVKDAATKNTTTKDTAAKDATKDAPPGIPLGSALRGQVGFPNRARAPWGWFDSTERERPLGEWFFDPAAVIKRHFNLGDEFATAYTYNQYLKR